jgi:hypothetical protein
MGKDTAWKLGQDKSRGSAMKRRTVISFWILSLFIAATLQPVWSENRMPISLFKVITSKDDVTIGMNAAELHAFGAAGPNGAGAIARVLADKKSLTVWQYSVRKASSGDLQWGPLHQIGLLANDSVRIEPYSTPLAVLAHD